MTFQRVFRFLCGRASRCVGTLERGLLNRIDGSTVPVFVIGPARSGTTLLYQALVHELNAGAVRQRVALFPYTPVLASRLSSTLCRDGEGAGRFSSSYGRESGCNGLVQGHEIWARWFPWESRECYLSDDEADRFRRTVVGLARFENSPFIIKWPGFVCYLDDLYRLFPGALFVFIDRQTEPLVRSIAQGRIRLRGNLDETISRSPSGGHLDGSEGGLEGILKYVGSVRNRIARFRFEVGEEQVLSVSYEGLCQAPGAVVDDVVVKYNKLTGGRVNGQGVSPSFFDVSNGVLLPEDIEKELEAMRLRDFSRRDL